MSAVAPASMMLVSNCFALFGSDGPVPLVTVCGKVSLFVTVILSPFFTVIVSGSKLGLPCTDAPASIVNGFPTAPAVALVVPADVAAVALVVPADVAAVALVVPADVAAVALVVPADVAAVALVVPADVAAVALVVPVDVAAVALVVPADGAAVALVVPADGAAVAGPLGPACTTSFPVMYG